MRRNEQTGQLLTFDEDYSNTLYHPVVAHIPHKNPVFTRLTFIAGELYSALDGTQRHAGFF